MNKTDNGVAPFLVHTEPPKGQQLVFNQVELRDYFAAAALQGLMASIQPNQIWSCDDVAVTCYRMADAMLKAREVKP